MRSLEEKLENLSIADIPARRALSELELGNTAYSGYRAGNQSEKHDVVKSVSSNFVVEGKKPSLELKSPYQEIINLRKLLIGGP